MRSWKQLKMLQYYGISMLRNINTRTSKKRQPYVLTWKDLQVTLGREKKNLQHQPLTSLLSTNQLTMDAITFLPELHLLSPPLPPWLVEKLPSMKRVPGAKKAGDRWFIEQHHNIISPKVKFIHNRILLF